MHFLFALGPEALYPALAGLVNIYEKIGRDLPSRP